MPLLKRKYIVSGIAGQRLQNYLRFLELNAQFKLWNFNAESVITKLRKSEKVQVQDLISELFSSYASSQGKRFWGDKTPSFFRKIDILASLFPNARFIHIVRDGRDVFASWRKLDPSKNDPAAIALDWTYKVFSIERSLRKLSPERYMTLRYEDLITNPIEVIRAVCEKIGISFEPSMLEFYRTSRHYIGEHHSELIFQPLDSSNKCKWKKTLTGEEAFLFRTLARPALLRFGYEKSKEFGLQPYDLFFVGKRALLGVCRRALQVMRTTILQENAAKRGVSLEGLPVGVLPQEAKAMINKTGKPYM